MLQFIIMHIHHHQHTLFKWNEKLEKILQK